MVYVQRRSDLSLMTDPLWEQQAGETAKSYRMFLQFAALPAARRTLAAAWRLYIQDSPRENTPMTAYYRKVAGNWCWVERAAARDMHIIATQQQVWEDRDKQRRETQYQLGEQLSQQAQRALRIIDKLDDTKFKVSLAEAKDVALAAMTLQENAIPTIQLAQDQIKLLFAQLPPGKRQEVMQRLMQGRQQQLQLAVPDINVVTEENTLDDTDGDETEET